MAKAKAINFKNLTKNLTTPRVLVLLVASILVVSMVIAAPHDKLAKKEVHKDNKFPAKAVVQKKTINVSVQSSSSPSTVSKPSPTPTSVTATPPDTIKSSAPVTPVASSAPTPGKGSKWFISNSLERFLRQFYFNEWF